MPEKWKVKAQIQSWLSALPFGESLNYIMQTRVTKSLPVSAKQMLDGRGKKALEHIQILRNHTDIDIANAVFYEFGSGWDLLIPQVFYTAGVNHQVLIDIEKHARLNLMNDIRLKINDNLAALFSTTDLQPRSLPKQAYNDVADLKALLDISYHAPCDGRKTGFADNCMDVCTNTFTLEHIPPEDIAAIFQETFRILKPGGYASCFVDMQDHYGYFDSNISVFNFLQFSPETWAKYNSSFHYQNRLRHPEYLAIFERCGFEIVRDHYTPPSEKDLDIISKLAIHESFQQFSAEQLGIRSSRVLLRKPL